MYIYVIKNEVNEYGERHISKVVKDIAIHHKSGVFVTKKNGLVNDTNVMLTYSSDKLRKLVMENAYNGYFSRDLVNQYRTQSLVEQTLARNALMNVRQVA